MVGTGAVGVTDLFDGLFDDAALFPPGDAPMAAAVPAHRELRERLGRLVGPFVVPRAGHFLQWERAELLNRATHAFLRDLVRMDCRSGL